MFTNKGFTLIELLIVVAIIGILGSVVAGAVGSNKVCTEQSEELCRD